MNVIESSRPRTASEGHATVGKNRGRTSLCPLAAGELMQAPQDAAFGLCLDQERHLARKMGLRPVSG
jgi:hypothetical protein